MAEPSSSLPWEGGAPILPVRFSEEERQLARVAVARIGVRVGDRAGVLVVLAALGLLPDEAAAVPA